MSYYYCSRCARKPATNPPKLSILCSRRDLCSTCWEQRPYHYCLNCTAEFATDKCPCLSCWAEYVCLKQHNVCSACYLIYKMQFLYREEIANSCDY